MNEELLLQMKALQEQKNKILEELRPIEILREEILNQMTPLVRREKELIEQMKIIKAPLYDIDMAISAVARQMGGKRMSDSRG